MTPSHGTGMCNFICSKISPASLGSRGGLSATAGYRLSRLAYSVCPPAAACYAFGAIGKDLPVGLVALRAGLFELRKPSKPGFGRCLGSSWRNNRAISRACFMLPECTENSHPDVVVMESAQDLERFDAPGPLNRARNRRILVQ